MITSNLDKIINMSLFYSSTNNFSVNGKIKNLLSLKSLQDTKPEEYGRFSYSLDLLIWNDLLLHTDQQNLMSIKRTTPIFSKTFCSLVEDITTTNPLYYYVLQDCFKQQDQNIFSTDEIKLSRLPKDNSFTVTDNRINKFIFDSEYGIYTSSVFINAFSQSKTYINNMLQYISGLLFLNNDSEIYSFTPNTDIIPISMFALDRSFKSIDKKFSIDNNETIYHSFILENKGTSDINIKRACLIDCVFIPEALSEKTTIKIPIQYDSTLKPILNSSYQDGITLDATTQSSKIVNTNDEENQYILYDNTTKQFYQCYELQQLTYDDVGSIAFPYILDNSIKDITIATNGWTSLNYILTKEQATGIEIE